VDKRESSKGSVGYDIVPCVDGVQQVVGYVALDKKGGCITTRI